MFDGRPVTPAEKKLHDTIAQLGCIACRIDFGIVNTYVSIHHVDGRTKPGCHMNVLPLCDAHHQGNGTALAIHVNKARFEKAFGKQADLVAAQWAALGVEYKPPVRGRAKAIDHDSKYEKRGEAKSPKAISSAKKTTTKRPPTEAEIAFKAQQKESARNARRAAADIKKRAAAPPPKAPSSLNSGAALVRQPKPKPKQKIPSRKTQAAVLSPEQEARQEAFKKKQNEAAREYARNQRALAKERAKEYKLKHKK